MFNNSLQNLFQTLEVECLSRSGSNHAPLFIYFKMDKKHAMRPFRFLNLWLMDETCLEIIKENWKEDIVGNPFIVYHHKINQVKSALTRWSKEAFGNIFQEIATLEGVLKVKEKKFEQFPNGENKEALSKA